MLNGDKVLTICEGCGEELPCRKTVNGNYICSGDCEMDVDGDAVLSQMPLDTLFRFTERRGFAGSF